MADLSFAGVVGQRAALARGETTARELLATSRRRIGEHLQLNAFRTLLDTADAEAAAADEALAAGDDRPLLGVPVAVKDSMRVAGHDAPLGTGSVEPPAERDDEVVALLRAAGAVVVGTTHLPELALWPFTESATSGITRNPWDPRHTPGGSSGGSAAAVAAGLVAAATASDGGGSIRIPAACCGLVGLKPTRGLVPAAEHWYGLSVSGVVTRDVADSALLLSVLAPGLVPEPSRPLRVAWSTRAPLPTPVAPEVRAGLEHVLALLGQLGHEVVEADPDYAGVQQSFLVRYLAGAADDLAGLADPSASEARTRAVAATGRRLRGAPLARALRQGEQAARTLAVLPGGADVLLTPTLPGLPPRTGSLTGLRTLALSGRRVPFTPAWNVTGQPALSLPVGLSREGLPLAVQLVGAPGADGLLLGLAAALEPLLGTVGQRPPVGASG